MVSVFFTLTMAILCSTIDTVSASRPLKSVGTIEYTDYTSAEEKGVVWI